MPYSSSHENSGWVSADACVLVAPLEEPLREIVQQVAAAIAVPFVWSDNRPPTTLETLPAILARIVSITSEEQLVRLQGEHAGKPPVVVLAPESRGLDLACMRAGAWDCLPETVGLPVLSRVISSAISEGRLRLSLRQRLQAFDERMEALTAKERSVMVAVCDGRLNKQIARDMSVSVRTIEERRRRVYEKMEVPSATQLAKQIAEVQTIQEIWAMRSRGLPPETFGGEPRF